MEQPTTKQVQKIVSDWLNGGYFDDQKEFAELVMRDHRTLQQCMFSTCMAIIQEFAKAYEQKWYDDRNEFACKTAKEILDKVPNMKYRAPLI